MVVFNCQRQGGCSYCNGQQSQSTNKNCLTNTEPMAFRLVDHGVPRNKIDRESTKFSLD